MKKFKMFLIVPAAILAVACGRDDSKKVDDALNADLTLAAQARPYTAMDSISAMERAYAAQGLAPVGYAPNGYAPVVNQPVRERVVYRDRPVYRSTRSSGSSRGCPPARHGCSKPSISRTEPWLRLPRAGVSPNGRWKGDCGGRG